MHQIIENETFFNITSIFLWNFQFHIFHFGISYSTKIERCRWHFTYCRWRLSILLIISHASILFMHLVWTKKIDFFFFFTWSQITWINFYNIIYRVETWFLEFSTWMFSCKWSCQNHQILKKMAKFVAKVGLYTD